MLTFANLGSSANPDIASDTDATSYSNSSWTPPTDGIICVFVVSRLATGPSAPTISGNSLTWSQVATFAVGSRRITLFAAIAAEATTGATTIDFGAETENCCLASFFQVQGVDISGGIAGAFVQTATNSGTGTSGSVTLAAAASALNRPISGFTHSVVEAVSPDAAWSELDELSSAVPTEKLETQYDDDGFGNASASWATSSNWIALAAEIKGVIPYKKSLLGVGV